MIAVLQRIHSAAVTADGVPAGACGRGFLILLGVLDGDTEAEALLLAEKIAKFRVFSDENGKMNLALRDIGGEVLVVSNFTLGANYSHGNRPDFMGAAAPARANELYLYFTQLLRRELATVQTGEFGAEMQVGLVGDGPITIVMNTDVLKQSKKES
jgi:D-tyrosyl-tRNA(Tyr) deacylase